MQAQQGGPFINRAMPGTPQQGMFQPMMPMYQPQPTDGISSAVSQISGGMDDEYTNRLLGALGLGDVSQYQMQQPVYQPMPFYNPYMNPYAGMFSPFMQQPFGPMFDTTASNYMGGQYDPTGGNDPMIEGSLPSFGLMGMLSELFGGDSTPSTTDDAYSSSDGGSMSSSQAASAAAADTDYGPSF